MCFLMSGWIYSGESPQEVKKINAELQTLETELQEMHKKTFNEEMQPKPGVSNDWGHYADDMHHAVEDEKNVEELEKEIEALKEHRQEIMQSNKAK